MPPSVKDKIPGGLAAGKPDSAFDAKALAQGIVVEMEHTTSRSVAKEITKDHLTEDPKYYQKLKRVEKARLVLGSTLLKGEGSRGGVIVGHTSTGKPIYASSRTNPKTHSAALDDHKKKVSAGKDSGGHHAAAARSHQRALDHAHKVQSGTATHRQFLQAKHSALGASKRAHAGAVGSPKVSDTKTKKPSGAKPTGSKTPPKAPIKKPVTKKPSAKKPSAKKPGSISEGKKTWKRDSGEGPGTSGSAGYSLQGHQGGAHLEREGGRWYLYYEGKKYPLGSKDHFDQAEGIIKRTDSSEKSMSSEKKVIQRNNLFIHVDQENELVKAIEDDQFIPGAPYVPCQPKYDPRRLEKGGVAGGTVYQGEHDGPRGGDSREEYMRHETWMQTIHDDPAGNKGQGGLAGWFADAWGGEPEVNVPLGFHLMAYKSQDAPVTILDDEGVYARQQLATNTQEGQGGLRLAFQRPPGHDTITIED